MMNENEIMGPIKAKEIQAAQQKVVETVRKLERKESLSSAMEMRMNPKLIAAKIRSITRRFASAAHGQSLH
jgi:hypothetical protein